MSVTPISFFYGRLLFDKTKKESVETSLTVAYASASPNFFSLYLLGPPTSILPLSNPTEIRKANLPPKMSRAYF